MFWYKYIYLQTTDIYPLFLLHHFKSLFFVYEKVIVFIDNNINTNKKYFFNIKNNPPLFSHNS